MRLIDADTIGGTFTPCETYTGREVMALLNQQPTACDTVNELRLLENYLYHKPKTYRQRNMNWVIARDLLMANTSHAGMTSCIMKCHELGIDPYGYSLKGGSKSE